MAKISLKNSLRQRAKPAAETKPKVHFVCLGCPKNQVNAERMMAELLKAGMELVENVYYGADVAIVNTCGFIDDAKKEAIESMLEMVQLKKEGIVKNILVTGCLAERYREEIAAEIPEIDGVLGLGGNDDIVSYVRELLAGQGVSAFPALSCLSLSSPRKLTSPEHWAYLQIADGCSNRCTYCKIPDIRGPFRSREIEDILAEAEALAQGGVRELVLIAQDVTCYGLDLYSERRLPTLLRALCSIEAIRWIRLLYCYPDEISDELIEVMAAEKKVVKYLDLPLQHADDRILKAMGRRGTQAEIRKTLTLLREKMPEIAIRTTFITGFPGEDALAFDTLSSFIEEQRFHHVGVFAFSPQEGTPAYDMPRQVDPEIARERAEILSQQQADIALQRQKEAVGSTIEVVVESYDSYSDSYEGRSIADAPEVDHFVTFVSNMPLQAGDLALVEILDLQEDSLVGRFVFEENKSE